MQNLIESFSGIRGIYGQSITEELARKYAWCYCDFLGQKKVDVIRPASPPSEDGTLQNLVVSGDSRASTPILKKAMLNTFFAKNVKRIIDVGIVPVQVCEYAVLRFKAQGGVYISASHNEPEYNGWKFLKEDGALLYPEQIHQLIEATHNYQKDQDGAFLQPHRNDPSKTKIIEKHRQAVDGYINFVLKRIGGDGLEKIKKSGFRILADPNGGSSIVILDKLFKELNVKAKIINSKLGAFTRLVEPNAESLTPLIKEFKNSEFEFGCGFDCDADRVEFVLPPDSEFAKKMGPVLSGQYVLALACDSQLQNTKNQVVVTNDVTSYLVRDVIRKHKAKVKEVEVGEMVLVEEMEKQKSIIGGEGSNGGVIIPPIKCRDGIMTVVLILKMLAERECPLTEVLENYPKFYSERTQKNCSPVQAIEIKERLERYFRQRGYKIKKTGGRDGGLKALLDENNYVWFRQSKTEAGAFRIISDGNNKKKVKELLKEGILAFNKASERK